MDILTNLVVRQNFIKIKRASEKFVNFFSCEEKLIKGYIDY